MENAKTGRQPNSRKVTCRSYEQQTYVIHLRALLLLENRKKFWAIFSKVEKRDWNIDGAEGAIETTKGVRQQKYEIPVLKLLTPCIFNQIIFS